MARDPLPVYTDMATLLADIDRPAGISSLLIAGPVTSGTTAAAAAYARTHQDAGGQVWWVGGAAPDLPGLWEETSRLGTQIMLEVAVRLARGEAALYRDDRPVLLVIDPLPARDTRALDRIGWLAEHGPTGTTPITLIATGTDVRYVGGELAGRFAAHVDLGTLLAYR